MTTIKIRSDPYNQTIRYYRDVASNWVEITEPQNRLSTSDFRSGLFSDKVKDIVDEIYNTYHSVIINFEGTKYDYDDLCDAITSSQKKITPIRDNQCYNTADIVFPQIRDIFTKDLKELFDKYQSSEVFKNFTQQNTPRFLQEYQDMAQREKQKQVVPICISGVMSSGKSAFINALIGTAILPSAAGATTAKICCIKQSKNENEGSIQFEYDKQTITIKDKDKS